MHECCNSVASVAKLTKSEALGSTPGGLLLPRSKDTDEPGCVFDLT